MHWLNLQTLIALATLTFLEIVLGVDNIIFISILSGKLPAAQQPRARRIGLLLAMGTRAVVGSVVTVPDAGARSLMHELHRRLLAGAGIAPAVEGERS